MTQIRSRVSTADEEFRQNRTHYERLIAALHEKRRLASIGGPPKARERHLARDKILPRDRVEVLLDPGSPFLELAQLAGEGRYDGVPPGASLITGIGLVSGRPCMVVANDATVKGGTYYGMTCKKHVRAQQIAQAHRLPCITLVDSGGAFLPDMANIFPDVGQFGSIFNNQVRMSAEGIPQIAVVMGPCTAGGAYIPALSDQVVIVREQGYMYLGGPELTYALVGIEHDRPLGPPDHAAVVDPFVDLVGDPCRLRDRLELPGVLVAAELLDESRHGDELHAVGGELD